ncbi:NADPH-dependent FMN reductase [Actinomadura sediminis]|uniref:NADPH-dependent FMN reductase n=1 Tax=Actinomadura sediminis TaxID=1038904 RepID=A0ABW3EPU6_9ACTN
MNTSPVRVAALMSSTQLGPCGRAMAAWLADRAGGRGDIALDLIDLAEARLPDARPAETGERPAAVADLAPWLASADAFVLILAECNRGLPASLKNTLDWYRREWAAKPVAFVSHDATTGGLLAVEQLRLVLAGLEALTLRDGVSLHTPGPDFASASATADAMLDRLVCWGRALRLARTAATTSER